MTKNYFGFILLAILALNCSAQKYNRQLPMPASQGAIRISVRKGDRFTVNTITNLSFKRNILSEALKLIGIGITSYSIQNKSILGKGHYKGVDGGVKGKNFMLPTIGISTTLFADRIAGRKRTTIWLKYSLYNTEGVLVAQGSTKGSGGKTKNLFISDSAVTDGFLQTSLIDKKGYVIGKTVVNIIRKESFAVILPPLPSYSSGDLIQLGIDAGSGSGSGSGGSGGSGGGGSGNDNSTPPTSSGKGTRPTQPDPCAVARPFAKNAEIFSQTPQFKSAKAAIKTASADKKEHAVVFGKDASNNIITSFNNNGTAISSSINVSFPGAFTSIHNHISTFPPSSGDFYNLITNAAAHPNLNTMYVVTNNGTVYALTITDPNLAQAFLKTYPPFFNPPYSPDFPQPLFDEEASIKNQYDGSDETQISFMLDKYKSGVALLKQGNDGSFQKISSIVKLGTNGKPLSYTPTICP